MSNRSSFDQPLPVQIEHIDDKLVVEPNTIEDQESFSSPPPTPKAEIEQEFNMHKDDDDFEDFDDFNDNFIDANEDDDEFGDFGDFEVTTTAPTLPAPAPPPPTKAQLYVDVLENRPADMTLFIDDYLNRMWGEKETIFVSSPIQHNDHPKDILNTPCSRDLWSKLSRDTIFYNPVTGAVGQFQWTRSETNKAYLNALGVTFTDEPKSVPTSPISPTKKRVLSGIRSSSTSPITSPDLQQSPNHQRSVSASTAGGLKGVTSNPKMDENTKAAKKEADQEMELDIDIARAYCELTEETIRVFPDVKLNAMVIELSRLQRQAAEYVENLLDQKEQLKMDAETYNDLISCIVGHAQRLHVQSKDSSPAMVTKTKKKSSLSNIMRRKTTTNNTQQSVSMGGGVVGLKQPGPTPKRTLSSAHVHTATETRRSM